MMGKDKHVHDFKPRTTVVPLHNYIKENGAIVKDLITGRDKLKQLVCKCGAVETLDLERSKSNSSPTGEGGA